MKIEVITIGDEILSGNIVDTNFAWLGDRLWTAGFNLHWHTTVGDEPDEISAALLSAVGRSEAVIVTGGLGPTTDDITLEVVAQAFGLPLQLNEQALSDIRAFLERFGKGSLTRRGSAVEGEAPSGFARGGNLPACRGGCPEGTGGAGGDASPSKLGRSMTPNNQKQAMLPEGARMIANPVGTAPGCHLTFRKTDFFFLPGVPREMKGQFDDFVLPTLRRLSPAKEEFRQTILRCFGAPEATIGQKLEGIDLTGVDLAYRVSFPEIFLKLSARGADSKALERKIAEVTGKIRSRLRELVYGEGEETFPSVVGQMLAKRKETLSIAESCTGGYLSSLITDVPGSSRYFERGVVTYSNQSKCDLLKVPESLIKTFGAVSSETAVAMAKGMRRLAKTTYSLAITGIAGPDGGTPGEAPSGSARGGGGPSPCKAKPVGTVFLALDCEGKETEAREFHFPTNRDWFKRLAAFTALDLLRKRILVFIKAAKFPIGTAGPLRSPKNHDHL